MPKPTKITSDGFTIVELIVTLVALGIFIVGIGSLFANVSYAQRNTGYVASATRAGSAEIEGMRNNNYNSLTPGATIDFSSQLPSDLPKGSTGTVVVSQPSADLRRVDVTVIYPVGSEHHQVVLSSLIGRIGIGK